MSVTYDALGWRMAERIQQAELLPGDALDIAFTLDHNDHPEFGGLELSLRDFKSLKLNNRDRTQAAVLKHRLRTENRQPRSRNHIHDARPESVPLKCP